MDYFSYDTVQNDNFGPSNVNKLVKKVNRRPAFAEDCQ